MSKRPPVAKQDTLAVADPNPSQTSPPRTAWLRELIESVAIAFALAFLFKTFQAEAFVIPTGSMAPTLMGRHKDVVCPECGYRYSASGSEEADREGYEKRDAAGRVDQNSQVVTCCCPICRFTMSVDPKDPENRGRDAHPSYSGDRIWVSKVPYHFMEPRRWDVVVFRFPEEAGTYYIKRLVGLPNEQLKIFHGDIFTKGPQDQAFVMQRKPPDKVRAMAQIVHDNDYVSPELIAHDWPLRWQESSDGDDAPDAWRVADDARSYQTDGSAPGATWIRYRHLVPSDNDWLAIEKPQSLPKHDPPPQLITDFYAFNSRVTRSQSQYGSGQNPWGSQPSSLGLHWVGDLILDCELETEGATGTALLDLVKGGKHFRCALDVATGEAKLTIDGLTAWQRTAETVVRGAGKHRVMFANIDRQLLLWVDDKVVAFDEPTTYEDLDNDRPIAGGDGGDLAPLGVGSQGLALKVSHLRVLRDIYYIADRIQANRYSGPVISDYETIDSRIPLLDHEELVEFLSTPEKWSGAGGNAFDKRRPDVIFDLAADQFFVLGDNSPASSDARFWGREQYVSRDMLIGKALFVYWPHSLNLFIPFTDMALPIIPNVPRMGLIR